MTNSNFTYLEKEFPILFNIGQTAESYLNTYPITCLFKLRQFGEKMSEMLFQEHNLEFLSENSFHNKLKALESEDVLPANVWDLFFAVKSKGNRLVHDNTGYFNQSL